MASTRLPTIGSFASGRRGVSADDWRKAFKRSNLAVGLEAFSKQANLALQGMVKEKRTKEAEERGTEQRASELAQRQEFTAGEAEKQRAFVREGEETKALAASDAAGLERQKQQETDRLLSPLEDEYGQLSQQLTATTDKAQQTQIAVQMQNLQGRIARMGGQVIPASEILQTQQLINPPGQEPENPELESLLDYMNDLMDGPIPPQQRVALGLLMSRMRKGDVGSLAEVYDQVAAIAGDGDGGVAAPQFTQPDLGRAVDILKNATDKGGFGLDDEDIPPEAFTDPSVFAETVNKAMIASEHRDELSEAIGRASALANKYEPEAIKESPMGSAVGDLLGGKFDAESLFNRPKTPDEAYSQAEVNYSDTELRNALLSREKREAIDDEFGPMTSTLLSIYFGINPNAIDVTANLR